MFTRTDLIRRKCFEQLSLETSVTTCIVDIVRLRSGTRTSFGKFLI